jgi:hypothetical protein
VRLVVNGEQPFAVHLGVDLRSGQAGVTKKLCILASFERETALLLPPERPQMPRLSTTTVATERDIGRVKPKTRRVEYRIRDHRNLLLRVTPQGTKSFAVLFLSPATGRWRKPLAPTRQ